MMSLLGILLNKNRCPHKNNISQNPCALKHARSVCFKIEFAKSAIISHRLPKKVTFINETRVHFLLLLIFIFNATRHATAKFFFTYEKI